MAWKYLSISTVLCVLILLLSCGKDSPNSPETSSSSSVLPPLSSSGLSSSVSSSSVSASSSSGLSSSSVVVPPSSSSSANSSATLSSSSVVLPSSSSLAVSSSSVVPSSSSVVVSSSSQTVSSSSQWPPFATNKSYGVMTDPRDGKVYKTILIDSYYTVMAQNLNYGVRVNGSAATDNQSNDAVVEKYCYNDLESNCDLYGGLYQWAEALALPSSCNTTSCQSQVDTAGFHQGICPPGWHIMKGIDWYGVSVPHTSPAGRILKSSTGWYNGGNGNNLTGFTGIGGGGFFQ